MATKITGKITIYIPRKSVFNRRKKAIRDAAAHLARLFGGATIAPPTDGFWVHRIVGLMRERVVQVYSFAEKDLLDVVQEDVIEWCKELKYRLGEESIMLEVNNVAYLV